MRLLKSITSGSEYSLALKDDHLIAFQVHFLPYSHR
jgi:hypothetical protein